MAEHFNQYKNLIAPELKKRQVKIDIHANSAPPVFYSSEPLIRQVIFNLLQTMLSCLSKSDINISIVGVNTASNKNQLHVEIKNMRGGNQISKKKAQRIAKLCNEQDINRIAAGHSIEASLKVALVIARQLNWTISYELSPSGSEEKFVLQALSGDYNLAHKEKESLLGGVKGNIVHEEHQHS